MRTCAHAHTPNIEICSIVLGYNCILIASAAKEMFDVTLILIPVWFFFFFPDILQDFSLCIYDSVITLNEVYISFSI